jgi:hypothetical protein
MIRAPPVPDPLEAVEFSLRARLSAGNKLAVLNAIDQELETHDSRQGKKFGGDS